MRKLYENVLGIIPLKLNQHFKHCDPHSECVSDISEDPEFLVLSHQLSLDLAIASPKGFTKVLKGHLVDIQENVLTLPSENLNVQHKRALWKLLHSAKDYS